MAAWPGRHRKRLVQAQPGAVHPLGEIHLPHRANAAYNDVRYDPIPPLPPAHAATHEQPTARAASSLAPNALNVLKVTMETFFHSPMHR